jgi:hypothetical protein
VDEKLHGEWIAFDVSPKKFIPFYTIFPTKNTWSGTGVDSIHLACSKLIYSNKIERNIYFQF